MYVQSTTSILGIFRVTLHDDNGRIRKIYFTKCFYRSYNKLQEWRNDYLKNAKPLFQYFNLN